MPAISLTDLRVQLSAGDKRRITIREFKNTLLLDVREYWTNDAGELKPGKKVRHTNRLHICVTNTIRRASR
jgi:hypothetical protein